MFRSIWLKLFFIFLLTHLIAIYFRVDLLSACTKPLLLITLIFHLLTNSLDNQLQQILLAALFFSLGGDVLLLFQSPSQPVFFIYGLISFLIAHVFYIIAFNIIRKRNEVTIKPMVLLPIALYYAGLICLLFSHLGALKIPVMVYGMVISMMLFVSLHLLYKKTAANQLIVIGAILFISSDSLLAIDKFYQPFELASILIMLTYAMAQYFIVKGAMNYLIKPIVV